MWWLLPAAVTVGSFSAAWHWCDGEPSRSEWGSLLVGLANIALFAGALFVTLAAWLIYFIVN